MTRPAPILLLALAATACTCQEPPPPIVTAVEPAEAPDDVDTVLTVLGAHFSPVVKADLDAPGRSRVDASFTLELVHPDGRRFALADPVLVSDGEIRVTLPFGAVTPQTYDLRLVDPRGRVAALADALLVFAPDCATEGGPCDDGDACTLGDSCQGRRCRPGAAVVCQALTCHLAGACDPGTGLCSNPVAPDGTPCDDGSLCTPMDTCQGGACVGSSTVVCGALDACHPGACDPGTGLCSNPAAPDGTPCQSACLAGETCQAGVCTQPPGGCLNTAPLARLAATPTAGTSATIFTFDASGSSDFENPLAALSAQFDFEGTGTFTAAAPAAQAASQFYGLAGITYQASVKVFDSGGLATYATALVPVMRAGEEVRVTTALDEADTVLDLASPGGTGLSLREAVAWVNAHPSSPWTITFDLPLAAVVMTLPQPSLRLTAPGVTVVGRPGLTVDFGGDSQACFQMAAPGQRLLDLAIRGCTSAFVRLEPGSQGSQVAYCDIGPAATALGVAAQADSPSGTPTSFIGPGNQLAGLDRAIWVEGTDYAVVGNRIRANATGIEVNGVRSRVSGNAVFGQIAAGPGTGTGLRIFKGAGPVEVWHNAFDGNAGDGLQSDAVPLDVRNNLFTNNAVYGVRAQVDSFAPPGALGPNGFWNNLGAAVLAPLATGPTDVLLDPRYVDRPAGDFRLLPGSLAVDAGVDTGLDVNGPAPGLYNGLAPDLGAEETPYTR